MLHDIAKFYGFGDVDDELSTVIGLTSTDKLNKSVITHVWFGLTVGLDPEDIERVVNTYKKTRGSPNILLRQRFVVPGSGENPPEHSTTFKAVWTTCH